MRVYISKHIILQLVLTRFVDAAVFHTNCSLPTQSSDFVLGSNVRSTLDILWSSLLAIFLCTWTAQHLNLPPQENAKSFVKRLWHSVWRKLKWMLVAIIMPEFMVGKALGDAVAAFRSSRCPDMQDHAKKSNSSWTMTHAFYANMGGFILRERPFLKLQNASKKASTPSSAPLSPPSIRGSKSISVSTASIVTRALEHCLCHDKSNWRQKHVRWRDDELIEKLENVENWGSFELPVAINTAHLCILMEKGLIQHLPSISENEILDKSKEDLVIKALALAQLAWFFIQLITRKAKDLPCAQLEIAVLGFAICSFATFLLWLKKPKDVKVATDIFTSDDVDPQRKRLIWLNGSGFFENVLYNKNVHLPTSSVPNDMYNKEASLFSSFGARWTMYAEDFGFMLGAVVFGACHFIAWNLAFPTVVEQIIWRVASIITTTIMPLFYFSWFILAWLESRWEFPLYPKVLRALSIPTYVVYALCRIYIMIELFRSLAYLPPDAFISTWSTSIPHIS